ncbi:MULTISPECIES: class II SORL domain-containing protein [Thermofilum]|jgi:superoxide reductase|uniref:Desulfoferrodoxin n=2 Tax=Thermofilum adornatum TaxID=1365176 RepID=S5Z5M1_9CREN|nr:class II SORL domain-containing protein [Thermofilum adornatum]AGT34550.1 desulfoferrodoxin [Thermofilum adornatum]AJB42286.1 Superoxide reductase [Thermofilum adornatum 1505]
MAKKFGDLIYSPEVAAGEAVSKVETHTPKIEAPDEVKAGEPFYIKIKVGPHPNTLQHSIRWIEVYFEEEGRAFNPIMLSRIHLEPELVEPEVTLKLVLKKSGVIYALEYCNLHGVWEGRKAITVK